MLHLVYRFDVGGLENGVVNLINHMPASAFRHAVVALTEVSDYSRRIERDDVQFIALHKPPGHAIWLYPKLFELFRAHRPAIVHTRNLAALEAVVPGWLAGVPVRIHGEHGRDIGDLDGRRRMYQWVRRAYRPFVSHYVALSRDLAEYLEADVGVPGRRISQVYNGVDTVRFVPASRGPVPIAGCPFRDSRLWLIGTIGRMQPVKDQCMLARAFARALAMQPRLASCLRLVMVGEGPLRAECRAILHDAGVADLAWLPGERADVADVLRGLSCFALSSLAEGISNTVLEAMASGLPVVATDVGGNADLVQRGKTGELVPGGDVEAMARQFVSLASDPQRAAEMGRAGRRAAETRFGLRAMVEAYQHLYETQLGAARATERRH